MNKIPYETDFDLKNNGQAAEIMAKAACLNAEILGMHAENMIRQYNGESPAYGHGAFIAILDSYLNDFRSDPRFEESE